MHFSGCADVGQDLLIEAIGYHAPGPAEMPALFACERGHTGPDGSVASPPRAAILSASSANGRWNHFFCRFFQGVWVTGPVKLPSFMQAAPAASHWLSMFGLVLPYGLHRATACVQVVMALAGATRQKARAATVINRRMMVFPLSRGARPHVKQTRCVVGLFRPANPSAIADRSKGGFNARHEHKVSPDDLRRQHHGRKDTRGDCTQTGGRGRP